MRYEPIVVTVTRDGVNDFIEDLPRVMQIYKALLITWDSSIDTNLAYEPDGKIVGSGDIGSILRMAEAQHYELLALSWPDVFISIRSPRGSIS